MGGAMEDTLTIWLVIAGTAVITFCLRFSFIALQGRIEIPQVVQRVLRYTPVAVLTAIVVPLLLNPKPGFTVAPDNLRLIAAVAAFFIARASHNILFTVAGGMLLLWSLQAVFR